MNTEILKKLNFGLLCLVFGFSLVACSGSGPGQGTLSTFLTDSSTDEYQAIYVTISRVEVHHDNTETWETVAEPAKTYNLLDLVNGVRETLGIAFLAADHYTQMRLIIGVTPSQDLNIFNQPHPFANYLINLDNEIHELKVPSGANTGLKIVNGFDIHENLTTELILDFDAMHSVVKAGSSGKHLLKPTVKVLNAANGAVASGIVQSLDTGLLNGALVSAQIAAPASAEAKDRVIIEAGTLTDANGGYTLFLAPGEYNLVAAHSGYLPGCAAVHLDADSVATVDFNLPTATAQGTIFGTVSLPGAGTDQYVTIDFRQELTCVDATEPAMITVRSVNIANGNPYEMILPTGDYQVVASTFGQATQVFENVSVISGGSTELNPSF